MYPELFSAAEWSPGRVAHIDVIRTEEDDEDTDEPDQPDQQPAPGDRPR